MSIDETQEKLEQQKKTIDEKYKRNQQTKPPEDMDQLNFIKRWFQCLNPLEGKTLEFKRGAPLRI